MIICDPFQILYRNDSRIHATAAEYSSTDISAAALVTNLKRASKDLLNLRTVLMVADCQFLLCILTSLYLLLFTTTMLDDIGYWIQLAVKFVALVPFATLIQLQLES
jgi:hypothetical protein